MESFRKNGRNIKDVQQALIPPNSGKLPNININVTIKQ